MMDAFESSHRLMAHIRKKLSPGARVLCFNNGEPVTEAASVLFLLGMHPEEKTPCLVFTRRSQKVRQPGDLCFPGGGVSPGLDRLLSLFLLCPGFPLFSYLPQGIRDRTWPMGGMSLLLATSLRESFEEMRLYPFRVTFLGPMAPERLKRFGRTIYPMAAFIGGRPRFSPNWEVERIVYIPLNHFFRPDAYGVLRIFDEGAPGAPDGKRSWETPCLIYSQGGSREVLWGVTYQIVMNFLNTVFTFTPPDLSLLPVFGEKTVSDP
jgi:8-oxo-dGTP pyrophosphatase MutT (NUDIX family)